MSLATAWVLGVMHALCATMFGILAVASVAVGNLGGAAFWAAMTAIGGSMVRATWREYRGYYG